MLEYEQETSEEAFEQLLLQLHKKNWKTIVQRIKLDLAKAKQDGDLQKAEKILQEFQALKIKMVKNNII